MADLVLTVMLRVQLLRTAGGDAGERGEGVISTAIAVLVIALLGAGMWAAFQTIFDGATQNIGTAVNSIGG